MFAHQVIDSLLIKPPMWIDMNFESCKKVANEIKSAQKFHFGNEECLINIMHNVTNHNLFMDDWRTNITPPYPITWFDCISDDSDVSKLGFLIHHFSDNTILIHTFVYLRKHSSWIPEVFSHVIDLNENGFNGFSYIPNVVFKQSLYSNMTDDECKKQATRAMSCMTGLSNFCLMILNCKNITTEIIHPPEKLNIKRRKNSKQELFSYHVLNVTLPSQKQGYRKKTDPNYHVRVHLCRGHFKEYTEEHPLFGSLTGRYWWQPHIRGQNHNGVVMKDYEVKQAIAV